MTFAALPGWREEVRVRSREILDDMNESVQDGKQDLYRETSDKGDRGSGKLTGQTGRICRRCHEGKEMAILVEE